MICYALVCITLALAVPVDQTKTFPRMLWATVMIMSWPVLLTAFALSALMSGGFKENGRRH
jgi:hypothetical protein